MVVLDDHLAVGVALDGALAHLRRQQEACRDQARGREQDPHEALDVLGVAAADHVHQPGLRVGRAPQGLVLALVESCELHLHCHDDVDDPPVVAIVEGHERDDDRILATTPQSTIFDLGPKR
eukprot:11139130-Alexandrium_andersonii.AAC.1